MTETQPGGVFGRGIPEQTSLVPLTESVRPKRESAPVNLPVVDDDQHIREVCRAVASDCRMNA
jgi:hypothetical protein